MRPEDVPSEWVELATKAVYLSMKEAAAQMISSLDEDTWPEWDPTNPVFSDMLDEQRHALAAVLPLAQRLAWADGFLAPDESKLEDNPYGDEDAT